MARNRQQEALAREKKVEVEGIVTTVLPEMRYIVTIDHMGMKHNVKCYVSGKMRKMFIEIKRGDKVRVEISLYDIDNGVITYRLTEKREFTESR